LIGISFGPESPWWLVRNNRLEEAEKALNRLSSGAVNNKLVLAMMVETDTLEFEMETGTRYWDVFEGTKLQREEIAVAVYTTQVFSGMYLVGYAAYFPNVSLLHLQAFVSKIPMSPAVGVSNQKAFGMSVEYLVLGFIGTCLSWILTPDLVADGYIILVLPSSRSSCLLLVFWIVLQII
jgi:MFS transporter, SP family, general alpha glucoside:H+ symporter